ncbi:hypothetical protein KFE96_14840 [Kordiimonas sp. SCSIO 12603]|uniref:FliH/SctL family protein n=1 Tax=Kordiimonas sp. SCSIO 12603 TaxID=2829596 RepID=UPI0021037B8B|nr:FliH/SctL family protein [Kordiimonas sp. SCSIO 12603]UTW58084.1 hypothetical protein KFE96_14840 [Kordiimonas sp. SCSIO 12603]
MADPIKFTFDQAFDGGAKSRYDLEIERLEQENQAAQASALTQGQEQGRQQALTEIEAATQEAMSQVAQAAHALFSQQAQLEASLKQQMVQLAYAIASKLSPALIRNQPLAEIEALIEDCLATANKEPRLIVRVSETLSEAISERLEDMKTKTNFPGDIVLIGEQSFGPQDCRVEWPDGGTERRFVDIQREIEDAVQRFVMSGSDLTESVATNTEEQTAPPAQPV